MVIINTRAAEVSIQAVSPLSIFGGAAGAAGLGAAGAAGATAGGLGASSARNHGTVEKRAQREISNSTKTFLFLTTFDPPFRKKIADHCRCKKPSPLREQLICQGVDIFLSIEPRLLGTSSLLFSK